MTKTTPDGKEGAYAPISNVGLAGQALGRAIDRDPMLPGIVCLYGPSGYGKTQAAAYCANKYRGIYVECRSFFKAKSLMESLSQEAGLRKVHTVAAMFGQLVEELALSRRPIIIDEVDHIVGATTLQVIRDLHDAAGCAVLLIGEENLHRELARTERFHNRVLQWVPAVAATLGDARTLTRYYSPAVEIADDLLKYFHKKTGANVRRLCVNLHNAQALALSQGWKTIDLAQWGDHEVYTGDAPPRRPT